MTFRMPALQFTIDGKPVAEGIADFKEKLKKALEEGLTAAADRILETAEEVVGEGYTRKYVYGPRGMQGSVEWPFISDATIDYYRRTTGVEITGPEDHPGLIHPDESRELITSLSERGAPFNVFEIKRGVDGFPKEMRVGTSVPYGAKLEFGGWQMWGGIEVYVPPRPYMATALYLTFDQGKIVKSIRDKVKEAMQRMGMDNG